MSAKSDYLEQQILNHIFRNTAIFTPPANVYVGLFTAAPSDSGGGTEVTGGSYARVAVTTTGGWTAPGAAGLTDNVADIVFPTASANWGTVVAIGIFDAASAGNLLYWNTVTGQAVNSGAAARIVAGALDVSEA